jgi:hypothetical protein
MAITKKQKQYSILFIFVLLISYFSFFDDYFKYLEVKKNGTSDACKSYYSEFPNGYFTEDVKVIEIQDLRDIVLVREFFNDYPNSEYSTVELINLEIWNDEIRRYDSIVESNDSFDQDAVGFFRELLTYMRDNNYSEIFVNLKGTVNVKNFDNYTKNIRKLTDDMSKYIDGRNTTGNIVNITSNYDDGDINHYEKIIIQSILNSFENLLSDNFISLSTYNDYNSSISDLVIEIDYIIENEEELYESNLYPAIWTYTIDKKFESYIIGVSMKFDFSFQLPNSDYSFSLQTNALDNISDIQNISDGYREMTEQNFQNFSDGILKRFGIYSHSTK